MKFIKFTFIGVTLVSNKLLAYVYTARLYLVFWLYGVRHGNIRTGGGRMRIRVSKRGKIIIGDNVNFANYWEVGWSLPCYLRVKGAGVLTIGNNVGINSSGIFCDDSIFIGDNVHIGGGTLIFDTDFHNMSYLSRREPLLNGISKTFPVVIQEDVFIGTSCIIGKGVIIGERSIVAAGSVVTKSIPNDELWGGNPAKFIRKINNS